MSIGHLRDLRNQSGRKRFPPMHLSQLSTVAACTEIEKEQCRLGDKITQSLFRRFLLHVGNKDTDCIDIRSESGDEGGSGKAGSLLPATEAAPPAMEAPPRTSHSKHKFAHHLQMITLPQGKNLVSVMKANCMRNNGGSGKKKGAQWSCKSCGAKVKAFADKNDGKIIRFYVDFDQRHHLSQCQIDAGKELRINEAADAESAGGLSRGKKRRRPVGQQAAAAEPAAAEDQPPVAAAAAAAAATALVVPADLSERRRMMIAAICHPRTREIDPQLASCKVCWEDGLRGPGIFLKQLEGGRYTAASADSYDDEGTELASSDYFLVFFHIAFLILCKWLCRSLKVGAELLTCPNVTGAILNVPQDNSIPDSPLVTNPHRKNFAPKNTWKARKAWYPTQDSCMAQATTLHHDLGPDWMA